jgi:hypothetical protein
MTTCSGFPNLIAGKLIHPSRSIWLRGRRVAGSIGGSRSATSGWAGCEAQTAVNGGSELLIFVPRAAHSHRQSSDSSRSAMCSVNLPELSADPTLC